MISCNFCNNNKFKLKYLYNEKPKRETNFGIKKKTIKDAIQNALIVIISIL